MKPISEDARRAGRSSHCSHPTAAANHGRYTLGAALKIGLVTFDALWHQTAFLQHVLRTPYSIVPSG